MHLAPGHLRPQFDDRLHGRVTGFAAAKSLDVVGLSWLAQFCNIALKCGAMSLNWQTRVLVPLFKKGDLRMCPNCRGTTLLSLPGKVYLGPWERMDRWTVGARIQDE